MCRITNIFVATALCAILLTGCKSPEQKAQSDEHKMLFDELAKTLKAYTDSITQAKDSTAYFRICDGLEDKMHEINFSHSPDTDLQLTEDMNDSLFHLTERYINAQREAEIRIFHPERLVRMDTVPDSLANVFPSPPAR